MFNENNVNVVDKINSWEEAINIAANPLLKSKAIKKEYIDSMIEQIKKLGFYVVIDEYIAMPHSRPENGVLNNAISFLKVNEGVYFGQEIIYLIFCFSAKDSNTHIDMLKELLDIFQNDEKKKKLLDATKKEELLKILGGNK